MRTFLIFLLLITFLPAYTLAQESAPYFSNFETAAELEGWTHYAEQGEDNWTIGSHPVTPPPDVNFGANCWVTGDGQDLPSNSILYLQSPGFELPENLTGFKVNFNQFSEGNASDIHFSIQYSLDGNEWFSLSSLYRTNWLSYGKFPIGTSEYIYSASSLHLTGYDSFIQFRFRIETGENPGAGCAIDRFAVEYLYYDIKYASILPNDTLYSLLVNDTETTLKLYYMTQTEWAATSPPIETYLYHSTDAVFDENDLLIDSADLSFNPLNGHVNWHVELGDYIQSGYNYFFYHLDATNQYAETNEDNNIGVKVVYKSPNYTVPYTTSFDSAADISWKYGAVVNNNNDFIGKVTEQTEYLKSGEYVLNNYGEYGTLRVESPSFNLTESENTSVCFWARSIYNSPLNPYRIQLYLFSEENTTAPSYPAFDQILDLGKVHSGVDWDCYCGDVSQFDGDPDFKFLFGSNNSTNNLMIDNFYIGPKNFNLSMDGIPDNLFSSKEVLTDTLRYRFVNSGLLPVAESAVNFYWSLDDVLDDDDILLSQEVHPATADTSSIAIKYAFNKVDNTVDTFYIIYDLDPENLLDETIEWDNIGAFKFYNTQEKEVPYFNDFEADADGWRSMSPEGPHIWRWSEPLDSYWDTIVSGKGLTTIDTTRFIERGRTYYFSPVFNIETITRPSIEFDFYENLYGKSVNGANIMYSINGGSSWHLVDNSNGNSKQFYDRVYWRYDRGLDVTEDNLNSSRDMYGGMQRTFALGSNYNYQGRFFDDRHHFVMNLEEIESAKQIQFMIVASFAECLEPALCQIQPRGFFIDNFSISEGLPDLINTDDYLFRTNTNDYELHLSLTMKNNGNSKSPIFRATHYLSIDSILDESDLNIGGEEVSHAVLRPYESYAYNHSYKIAEDISLYKYVIVQLDPENEIQESDEENNIAAYPLVVNTETVLPEVFTFGDLSTSGWAWNTDGNGYRDGCVIRDYTVPGEFLFVVEGTVAYHRAAKSWDSPSLNTFPHYYFYSPSFDFTNWEDIRISFKAFSAINVNGGAYCLEYSLDSGENWQLLGDHKYQNPEETDWYSFPNIPALEGRSGWAYMDDSLSASFDFLAFEPNVRFRFDVHSTLAVRWHDFTVSGNQVYNTQDTLYTCTGDSIQIGDSFTDVPGSYYKTFITEAGTDSIVLYHLDNYPSYAVQQEYAVCITDTIQFEDGSIFYGFTEDFSHSIVYETVNQCDSIIIKNVEVFSIDTSITLVDGTLFSAYSDSQSIDFQWLDCNDDFSPLLPYQTNFMVPQYNGSYAVEITTAQCVDTTSCVEITNLKTGITPIEKSGVKIYPNPSDGVVKLECTKQSGAEWYILQDSRGAEILRERVYNRPLISIDLPYSNGVYIIRVIFDDGRELIEKVVKVD